MSSAFTGARGVAQEITVLFSYLQEWQQQKFDQGFEKSQISYVYNQSAFDEVNVEDTEYLMGK